MFFRNLNVEAAYIRFGPLHHKKKHDVYSKWQIIIFVYKSQFSVENDMNKKEYRKAVRVVKPYTRLETLAKSEENFVPMTKKTIDT